MASEDKYPEPTSGPPPQMNPGEGIAVDHPLYQEHMNKLAQQESSVLGMMAPVMDHRPSVSQQLAMRKAHLEHELKLVNEAIEHALANTPTMALLDSISKVGLR